MSWNQSTIKATGVADTLPDTHRETTAQKVKSFPWELAAGRRGSGRSHPAHTAAGVIHEAAQPCAFCRGSGVINKGVTCPVCRGQGTVVHARTPLVQCAFCRGYGEKPLRSGLTCGSCRGSGFVAVAEPVENCPACRGRGGRAEQPEPELRGLPGRRGGDCQAGLGP